ncbi:MAG TPA: pyridoxamine 5'-phosphate oxidase family protein [Ktedonobacteraceae bacterium]|nr:pyridoxamine 5'-phosphate oxidase family protein [Ktedonobacteraceae bacterium]
MANMEPMDERNIGGDGMPLIPWARAQARLEEDAGLDPTMLTHWLATVRPDGRPHVMPVWAVWVSGAFYFNTGATTRKGKNLAHNSHCVITAASPGLDLVVEGKATRVSDEAELQRIAKVYASLGWHPTVRNGAFYADAGAPSAGSPPYYVYEVVPATIFGLANGATRWSF